MIPAVFVCFLLYDLVICIYSLQEAYLLLSEGFHIPYPFTEIFYRLSRNSIQIDFGILLLCGSLHHYYKHKYCSIIVQTSKLWCLLHCVCRFYCWSETASGWHTLPVWWWWDAALTWNPMGSSHHENSNHIPYCTVCWKRSRNFFTCFSSVWNPLLC